MITLSEALKSDSQRKAFFAQLKKGAKSSFKEGKFGELISPRRHIEIDRSGVFELDRRGSAVRQSLATAIKKARKVRGGGTVRVGKENLTATFSPRMALKSDGRGEIRGYTKPTVYVS